MSSESAMRKKFDRWMPRLNDLSSDVRQKAAIMMIEVVQSDTTMKPDALLALVNYLKSLKKNSDNELFLCLYYMQYGLESTLASSSELLDTLLDCPLNNSDVSNYLMHLLWNAIDKGHIQATHSAARSIVKVAKCALKQKHFGGRRDALLITDWGEDNLEDA